MPSPERFLGMKRIFVLLAALLVVPFLLRAEALDYNDPRNWVIPPKTLEGKVEDGTEFDLFYVYPTLVSSKEKPLMDRFDPKVRAKTE